MLAAGPVSRILSAGLLPQDGHSSGLRITAQLKRPTRRLWHAEPARAVEACAPNRLPPYLVLLRVGFALPAPLLQRRCALTAPFHPYLAVPLRPRCIWRRLSGTAGRYVFCGTSRQPTLRSASRTLSGTLLCGVRTFLPHF